MSNDWHPELQIQIITIVGILLYEFHGSYTSILKSIDNSNNNN